MQGWIFSVFCLYATAKENTFLLAVTNVPSEVRSAICVWDLKKIAYGTRARKNHTETGLKNPRTVDVYLWDFGGGNKTKHKHCGWEQEEIQFYFK